MKLLPWHGYDPGQVNNMDKLWERSDTNTGIPYYIDHVSERTQWDHPEFLKALRTLDEMSDIKLAVYRAAMKLRTLQKSLNLDLVDISIIDSVFDRHGFRHNVNAVLDVIQLRNIIYEMFQVTRARRHGSMLDVDFSTDMLVNWILNLYDETRTGYIKVLSTKVCIVALCASGIIDKYHYWYQQLTDRADGISRRSMTSFLQDLISITELINESSALGRNASAAVNSCFETIIGTTVSQDRYMNWLSAEPQTIAWLPTMHRLATSENMRHEAKCNICKLFPIIGLRFRCLKCLNYDMCQECFFVGLTSKKHKVTHPTQEYVFGTTSTEDIRAFAKTIRNKLSMKRSKGNKPNYLPVDDTDTDFIYRNPTESKDDMHYHLGRISEQLAAVEDIAPSLIPSSSNSAPSPNDWMRPSDPSPDSLKASVKSQESSRDLSPERRHLENMINALEQENEELMNDIDQLVQNRQISAPSRDVDPVNNHEIDASSDGSNSGVEAELIRARQDVLEDQNKQLERQLKTLKELLKEKQPFPKASTSMYMPNHLDSAPSHHAPPTRTNMDQTAPPTLSSYHGATRIQHHNGVIAAHGGVIVAHDDVMLNEYVEHVNDSNKLRPPNRVNQSVKQESMTDIVSILPPLSMDQSVRVQPNHQLERTNPTMTPGLIDSTLLRPSYNLNQSAITPDSIDSTLLRPPNNLNQSAMTPGTFGSRPLLPAHLTDQSTVMFPNVSASRVFPSEEAEMNEIIKQLNEAYPVNDHDEAASPEFVPPITFKPQPTFMRTRRPRGTRDNPRDMIDAVSRISDAMSNLVARVTDRPSVT